MQALKIGFWLHLGLVVITSYIVITYFFEPHDNHCQMTFMMEPPKFIPIPIHNPIQQSLETPSSGQDIKNYKLFMYSEFGFPLESNIRRDLKDSMPILFVPGNAGSYQQVRSLASTCIRRHLQSLDAFKFVFYTIDFRAQLSGLDGELIEQQTRFLHLAVKKIIETHPTETNGVILVGHSVGGFIAKALSTDSDFDPNSIPLLINLASPLTKPFVNFDSKMGRLYHLTKSAWNQRQNSTQTLSISISGGTSDRLVPKHLSLDPQYDISLTTSSIDNVWLTTDHVSITWCRELMNKLAQLLSALMDKKEIRLIDGKEKQIAIAMDELVTNASNQIDTITGPTGIEQTVLSTGNVKDLIDSYIGPRNTLISTPTILNVTNRKHDNLLVWLEHIETFKKNNIYGCQDVSLVQDKAHCVGKINLSNRMRTIPSRRYELKKKSFIIKDESHIMKYLIIDFTSNARNGEPRKYKIPESISVQLTDDYTTQTLYIPTLLEYLFISPWAASYLTREIISSQKQPLNYVRFEIMQLNRWAQYFSIMIEPKTCATSDKHIEMTALLIQDRHVVQSFHPKKDSSSVIVKLNAQKFILMHNQSTLAPNAYIELFMDGSCQTDLKIRFDLWSFLEAIIQNYLGHILILSSFIAYATTISRAPSILPQGIVSLPSLSGRLSWLYRIIFFVLFFTVTNLNDPILAHDLHDGFVVIVSVLVLAGGSVALIEYLIDRLVDLATIVNNFQMFIRSRVLDHCKEEGHEDETTSTRNGNGKIMQAKSTRFDYEWSVIVMTAIGSLVLSVTLMKLCIFFMLLKLRLKLSLMKSVSTDDSTRFNEVMKKPLNEEIYMMTLSMATISTLSLICNIPAALLKINSLEMFVSIDLNLIASLISLISAKIICQWMESLVENDVCQDSSSIIITSLSKYSLYLPLSLAFVPIRLVSSDIRIMSHVELILFILIVGSLSKIQTDKKKRKKTD